MIPKTLPSGRMVLDTGRVQIGLRHERQQFRDQGAGADAIQQLLLDSATRSARHRYDEAFKGTTYRRPSSIPLDNSWRARLYRWWRWAVSLRGPKL